MRWCWSAKDVLILCLVGVIVIEVVSMVLGITISLTIFHAWQAIDSILDYFKRNPIVAGTALLLTHTINTILRLSLTLHYNKKYGIRWSRGLLHIQNIVPILAVVLFLEVILFPILSGEVYEPQIVCEYRFFKTLGTGLIGYIMQFLYYVGEGVLIASILEIGSRLRSYGGLILLLIFWTPWHLFRLTGIDFLNFTWAIVTLFILEWCRRKSGLVTVVLVWLLIIVL